MKKTVDKVHTENFRTGTYSATFTRTWRDDGDPRLARRSRTYWEVTPTSWDRLQAVLAATSRCIKADWRTDLEQDYTTR